MNNTLKDMNRRHIGILGLAALGLAMAAPVQAASDLMQGAFIVAKRERADEVRPDPRDDRRETRRDRREAERDEPQGYGYGYERRQQQRNPAEDRPRGRRQAN